MRARIPVLVAAALLAGCGAATDIFRPEVPQPEPVEFRPHTNVGGPLAGAYLPQYQPFRRARCPGGSAALGNPYCTGAAGARRSYIWHDGSERGALRVKVTRFTYPMLASRNDPALSVRPVRSFTRTPPKSPGETEWRKWWAIWRDTMEIQRGDIGEVRWEIPGRWRTDSVHIQMDAVLPLKVGTTSPATEFPEPFVADDGRRYYHPAEDEVATFRGSIMRTGHGDYPARYARRCHAEVRPLCSHIDPVVVVTIHGGGVATLEGRWWRPSWAIAAGAAPEGRVEAAGRPDFRGHVIFKHLGPRGDGFTGNLPYHPHTRVEGRVAVTCDNGARLEADIPTLKRLDATTIAALGWVFVDCDARTVTTMRQRYPDTPTG